MESEEAFTHEPKAGVSYKSFRTASREFFLKPGLRPGIMVTLFILEVWALVASGLWRIAAGDATFVILLGFTIRSLYHRK